VRTMGTRRLAPRQETVEAKAEYRPCWLGRRAPVAEVGAKVPQAPLAPAKLRPNQSLKRRPSTAGCLARAAAREHHRPRGQGSRPLRAP